MEMVVGVGTLAKEPVSMLQLVQDHASQMEPGSLDEVDQPALETGIQLLVSEPSEDPSPFDNVLPVEADRIIVRVRAEDLLSEPRGPGQSTGRDLRIQTRAPAARDTCGCRCRRGGGCDLPTRPHRDENASPVPASLGFLLLRREG